MTTSSEDKLVNFKAPEQLVSDFDDALAKGRSKYRTRSEFLRAQMEQFIKRSKT